MTETVERLTALLEELRPTEPAAAQRVSAARDQLAEARETGDRTGKRDGIVRRPFGGVGARAGLRGIP